MIQDNGICCVGYCWFVSDLVAAAVRGESKGQLKQKVVRRQALPSRWGVKKAV